MQLYLTHILGFNFAKENVSIVINVFWYCTMLFVLCNTPYVLNYGNDSAWKLLSSNSVKQIVCNHSTGKKNNTTQDIQAGRSTGLVFLFWPLLLESTWKSHFNSTYLTFPISKMGRVLRFTHLTGVLWGLFMACFHIYCWKALCKYSVVL